MARMTCEELLRRYAEGERDFRGADLSGLDLRGKNLSGVDFSGANLKGADFAKSDLTEGIFSDVQTGVLEPWATGHRLISFLMAAGASWLAAVGGIVFVEFAAEMLQKWIASIAFTAILIVWRIGRRHEDRSEKRWDLGFVVFYMLIILLGSSRKGSLFFLLAEVALYFLFVSMGGVLFGFGASLADQAIRLARQRSSKGRPLISLAGAIIGTAVFVVKFQVLDPPTKPLHYFGSIGGPLLAVLSVLLLRRRMPWTPETPRWIARIGGTCFRKADLTEADLAGARLECADLRGAVLIHTRFHGSDIEWALFDSKSYKLPSVQALITTRTIRNGEIDIDADEKPDLSGIDLSESELAHARWAGVSLIGADLSNAQLHHADLVGAEMGAAILRGTDLRCADLELASLVEADLEGADLRGASLLGANLEQAELAGARLDLETYLRSGWTPPRMADLCGRGAQVIDLSTFPREVQEILAVEDGLTLYFSTRLSAMDKLLVEGIIVGVLGRDTDVHVAEYLVQGQSALVRLAGAHRADLEMVAEALYQKVWEQAEAQVQQTALVRVGGVLRQADLREGLSDLMGNHR